MMMAAVVEHAERVLPAEPELVIHIAAVPDSRDRGADVSISMWCVTTLWHQNSDPT